MLLALRRFTLPLLLVLAAAACSSDDSADGVASLESTVVSTTAPASGPDPSDEEAVLAFTQCMREEGIDVPDPSVDASGNLRLNLGQAAAAVAGVDQDVLNAAFLACQSFLEGVSLGFDVGDTSEFEDRLLRFAVCMRENGIDLPDPDFSAVGDGDIEEGPFGALDLDDPLFQDALDVCGDVLAGFDAG